MERKRIYLNFFTVGSVFFLILFLGSCGNNKNEPSTNEKIKKIEVLIDWKAEPTYAAFYCAKELGFYKDAGFDVEIIEGNGAPTSAKLISQGKYKIGSCSGAATAIGISQKLDIISTAVYYHNLPTVIYSLVSHPIKYPEDLYEKKIGVNYESINYKEFQAFIIKTGLDITRINEVGVGWDVAPLLQNKVDGLMNYAELSPILLQTDGYKVEKLKLSDYGVKLYSLNLIANKSYYENNKLEIEQITIATNKGFGFVANNPDSAAVIFSKLFPHKNNIFINESMKIVADQLKGNEQIGSQTMEGWKNTLRTLQELDLIKNEVNIVTIFNN